MARLVLALALVALAVAPAAAHSFYDKACCADADCHPVACERITAVNGGFEFRAYDRVTYFFTRDKMKPSQDESCHVCVNAASHSATCIYLRADF